MKIPARCNKRSCQARRNLSKRPEEYKRWPKCHYKNCDGKMYVDEYRLQRGAKDRAPACTLDCYPIPHRVDQPRCRHYAEYTSSRNRAPRSKHSPIPAKEWVPF